MKIIETDLAACDLFLAALAIGMTPITPAFYRRGIQNLESLRGWPGDVFGLLALGDGVCAFNLLRAGMASAAVLRRHPPIRHAAEEAARPSFCAIRGRSRSRATMLSGSISGRMEVPRASVG
jgi:hypothetical protein